MKHPLLLAAVLLPCLSWGQKIDSTVKFGNVFSETTISVDNGLTIFVPKEDTVKVLMLLTDTTFVPNVTSIMYLTQVTGFTDTIGYIPNRIPYVWFQFGYVVYKIRWVHTSGEDIFLSPTYLDENKKPLPKSLIIWITKEVK